MRPRVTSPTPKAEKISRLTIAEVQTISTDTPSEILEFSQPKPWTTRRPTPSSRPVISPKHAANTSRRLADTVPSELSCGNLPRPVIKPSLSLNPLYGDKCAIQRAH